MVRPQRLLLPGQRPYVHLLRLGQLTLGPVQDPEIVDGVEGQRVVRSQRLLAPGQRPHVHSFCRLILDLLIE